MRNAILRNYLKPRRVFLGTYSCFTLSEGPEGGSGYRSHFPATILFQIPYSQCPDTTDYANKTSIIPFPSWFFFFWYKSQSQWTNPIFSVQKTSKSQFSFYPFRNPPFKKQCFPDRKHKIEIDWNEKCSHSHITANMNTPDDKTTTNCSCLRSILIFFSLILENRQFNAQQQ